MTLEQLRIFVAIARREHVSQAAHDLNLTQSAASGALHALEARYGVRLFDRIGRGVKLNATGRALLAEAEAILALAQAAERVLDDLSTLRRGVLSLRATPTIANYWLPRRLAAFHASHPAVDLTLDLSSTDSVMQAVAHGEVELGFAGVAPTDPALSKTAVGDDQLVLLAPAGHSWGDQAWLDSEDLKSETWVMREAGSGTRDSLEFALRAAGADPQALTVSLTLPSNEAVLGAVEAGAGVSALSEIIALPAVAAGRLVRAPLPLPARPFYLVQRRDAHVTSAAAAFIASLT